MYHWKRKIHLLIVVLTFKVTLPAQLSKVKQDKMATRNTVSFPVASVRNPELVFHLTETKDAEELSEFIMKEFFHQFPLKNAPGFDVEKEIRPWINQYISHMCFKNYSIILRDTINGNKIVAAAITDLNDKDRSSDDIDLYSFCDPVGRPCWEKICRLLDGLHVGIDLGQDPMLSMDLVAVSTGYYNRGLSTECVRLTVQLAESRNLEAVKMEAVNKFMTLAAEKVGFQTLSEIDMTQWEFNGEKPFANDDIHQKAKLLIYKIKNFKNQ